MGCRASLSGASEVLHSHAVVPITRILCRVGTVSGRTPGLPSSLPVLTNISLRLLHSYRRFCSLHSLQQSMPEPPTDSDLEAFLNSILDERAFESLFASA